MPLQAVPSSTAAPKAPKSQPGTQAQKEGHHQGLLSFHWPAGMHLGLPKQHVSYLECYLLADDGFF